MFLGHWQCAYNIVDRGLEFLLSGDVYICQQPVFSKQAYTVIAIKPDARLGFGSNYRAKHVKIILPARLYRLERLATVGILLKEVLFS